MTILQRLMRAMMPKNKLDAGFEDYYSKLLSTSVGTSGLPTASEAQRDLQAVRARQQYYF